MTHQDTAPSTHDALDDPRNADILIYVNGDIVHREDAKVSVYDSGFMLGDGIWEGMLNTDDHHMGAALSRGKLELYYNYYLSTFIMLKVNLHLKQFLLKMVSRAIA